ncbi:MAG: type II secretion system F family protein [Lachnospiraceae bacterium]|nr:type II secretion system F family protein [Lachnospiraceae bacterium]
MAKNKAEQEPQFIPSPINGQMINYKVYYMSFGEKLFAFLVTFVLGGLAGLVFYGGLFKQGGEATMATHVSNIVVFTLIGGIASKFFIPAIKNSFFEKRAKKLRKQFMDLLEVLSASLSAGNTVNDAFLNARGDLLNQYSEKEYIIRELAEISSGITNGKTLEEMVMSFGARSNNEDIENFGNVISNCYRLGGNFNDVISRTRKILGDKIGIEDEIQTKLASNVLQHNAMCLMPIILVSMLKLMNESFSKNLASGVGVVVTTVAIAIFVGSYFWGRKIIDIK